MSNDVKETDTILFRYDHVNYVPQKRQMSCWYACAKMVYAFQAKATKVKHIIENGAAGKDILALKSKSKALDDPETSGSVGATEKEWPLIAEGFGFKTPSKAEVLKAGSEFKGLQALLEKYGPLWCAGRFYQGGTVDAGHVIVVTGVMTREVMKKPAEYVIFHDPAPANLQGGPDCVKQYTGYFKSKGAGKNGLFSWEETEGVSPIMYK